MFLGSNKEISEKLRTLTEEQPRSDALLVAVAFWGDGAQTLINSKKRYKIICNLAMGGTNPSVIREISSFSNVEIRHKPDLHAKVVAAKHKAIVGSSNFSSAGLGLESSKDGAWTEAASVIDSRDVKTWFNLHWDSAFEITEDVLASADALWNGRANRNAEDSGRKSIGLEENTLPELTESELFKSSITGGNKIRMAARSIELIYFDEIEPETKRSVWIPAYAASLIWVTAGNKIATKIEDIPYFETQDDVLERANYPKTIEKLMQFIKVLSSHPKCGEAIQYWANKCLEVKNLTRS